MHMPEGWPDQIPYDYGHFFTEALSMDIPTLRSQIHQLRHLSDDPEDPSMTAGQAMQLAAYTEALEKKVEKSNGNE